LSLLMPHSGLLVGHAAQKFDAAGELTDESTRTHLTNFLRDFQQWVTRQSATDLNERRYV